MGTLCYIQDMNNDLEENYDRKRKKSNTRLVT